MTGQSTGLDQKLFDDFLPYTYLLRCGDQRVEAVFGHDFTQQGFTACDGPMIDYAFTQDATKNNESFFLCVVAAEFSIKLTESFGRFVEMAGGRPGNAVENFAYRGIAMPCNIESGGMSCVRGRRTLRLATVNNALPQQPTEGRRCEQGLSREP